MPHKDPEKRREYMRAYRAANRERLNAAVRSRRAANPEPRRAAEKRWYEAHPERRAAAGAAYYIANRQKVLDQSAARYAANPDRARERNRNAFFRRAHGLTPEQFAQIWEAQKGLCYLGGHPLPTDLKHVHIDHDHSCCPPNTSCAYCRRGLACQSCNNAIGLLMDDPDLMERAADALRAAKREARKRIANKPVQEELPINVAPLRRRKESA